MVKVVNKDSFHDCIKLATIFIFKPIPTCSTYIFVTATCWEEPSIHLILFYFILFREEAKKKWENFRTKVINKGGLGALNFPK